MLYLWRSKCLSKQYIQKKNTLNKVGWVYKDGWGFEELKVRKFFAYKKELQKEIRYLKKKEEIPWKTRRIGRESKS